MTLDAPVGATGPILILRPRRIGDVRRFDVFWLDGWRTGFGHNERLSNQQGSHRIDAFSVIGSFALDDGADARMVSRTVGILAAADPVAVKERNKLRTPALQPYHACGGHGLGSWPRLKRGRFERADSLARSCIRRQQYSKRSGNG